MGNFVKCSDGSIKVYDFERTCILNKPGLDNRDDLRFNAVLMALDISTLFRQGFFNEKHFPVGNNPKGPYVDSVIVYNLMRNYIMKLLFPDGDYVSLSGTKHADEKIRIVYKYTFSQPTPERDFFDNVKDLEKGMGSLDRIIVTWPALGSEKKTFLEHIQFYKFKNLAAHP